MLKGSPNGQLHLALAVALVASSVIALVAPISRTTASEDTPPAQARGGGLAGVLQTQAASLSQVLATPAATSAGRGTLWGVSLSVRLTPLPLLEGALRLGLGRIFANPEPRGNAAAAAGPVAFTLHEDGLASPQAAPGPTVGDALTALGVAVSQYDLVSPEVSSPLVAGMHVYVQHAVAVEVVFGSERRTVFTRAATVGEVLTEAGYTVEPTDLVFPPLESLIASGGKITVTTLRETIEYRDQPIPFDTRYEYDARLPQGESAVVQAGVEGHFRRQYRVRSVNGVEVLRELVSEVVIPPTDEVLSVGTYVAPAPAPTPPPAVAPGPGGELVCVRTLTVYATWYTAASAGGSGITATGVPVDKGIVAVDPSVIALGTHMYIPGYGYAVAADTGGGIIGNMIDLGFGDDDVPDWHTQWVDICILD